MPWALGRPALLDPEHLHLRAWRFSHEPGEHHRSWHVANAWWDFLILASIDRELLGAGASHYSYLCVLKAQRRARGIIQQLFAA